MTLHPRFVSFLLSERKKRRGEQPLPPTLLAELTNFQPQAPLPQNTQEAICATAAQYFFHALQTTQGVFAQSRFPLRLAVALTLTYLRSSGLRLHADEMELFKLCTDAWHGEASVEEMTEFFKMHIQPVAVLQCVAN